MKLNTDIFIERCGKIHGDKYDYSMVEYKTNRDYVKIVCNTHGEFLQRADVHMSGSGCKLCKDDEKRGNILDFIERSNEIHNNVYDYSKYIYSSYNNNSVIVCKIHGDFLQAPHNHLKGQGCPKCNGGISYILQDFIDKSNKVHNFKYNYDKCEYVKSNIKVIITCEKHGDFMQKPNNHLSKKYGCPKCGFIISKVENDWLDNLNIPLEFRQKTINNKDIYCRVDAYDPIRNVIYEFYGDFWHGNPNIYKSDEINPVNKLSFGELYSNTIDKENKLKLLGYNIVSIWESDFKKINNKLCQ